MAGEHPGIGTHVLFEDPANPGSFLSTPQLRDIKRTRTTATINVTNHDSPNRTIEKKPGLKDPGVMTFTMFYLPEDHIQGEEGIGFLYENQIVTNMRLVLADGLGTWSGQGFFNKLDESYPSDGNMMTRDGGLELTGVWVFGPTV